MRGAQPTRREDQLKPFDDVAHETDAKHAICEAFFDPEEEAGEEGGETYYDFPSTKLVQAAFSVTEHFQLGLTKEALALMMAAFDGFKEQPKMVQAKEDQDGNVHDHGQALPIDGHKDENTYVRYAEVGIMIHSEGIGLMVTENSSVVL